MVYITTTSYYTGLNLVPPEKIISKGSKIHSLAITSLPYKLSLLLLTQCIQFQLKILKRYFLEYYKVQMFATITKIVIQLIEMCSLLYLSYFFTCFKVFRNCTFTRISLTDLIQVFLYCCNVTAINIKSILKCKKSISTSTSTIQ